MTELLSKRETEALLLVACYRFLSLGQLEEFILGGSQTTELSRQVITRRIVQRLRTRGLLAATRRLVGGPGGGSTRMAYYLSPSGLKLAASLEPGLPPKEPRAGTFLMQHALATADVALAFRRAARTNAGHELLQWECDWQAAQKLRRSAVVPDARLVYATADYEVDAFLEIDLGSEGTRFFGGKIFRYLELFRSGEWRDQLALWPVVLTVAPSESRAAAVARSTETVLGVQPDRDRLLAQTEFAFAALPAVVSDPLAIVWRIAGRDGTYALLDGRHLE
ncbi:MAG: replication-relaxation family protein [Nitriliruptorales bacterium]